MTNVTKITIHVDDDTVKNINVADDGLVVRNGRCTKFKKVDECSVKELIGVNNGITEITITLSDGTKKSIKVSVDGLVLIRNGRATKFKQVGECSVKELLANAKENGRS